jgi:hypothetical protein
MAVALAKAPAYMCVRYTFPSRLPNMLAAETDLREEGIALTSLLLGVLARSFHRHSLSQVEDRIGSAARKRHNAIPHIASVSAVCGILDPAWNG